MVMIVCELSTKMKHSPFSRRSGWNIPLFIAESTVKIKEKGETKTAVSDAEVVKMVAQAVLLKDHGHGTAIKSPFPRRSFRDIPFILLQNFLCQ
jgi:hypothetical protein